VERYFTHRRVCLRLRNQTKTDVTALKESDAYPAMPEDGYGWEKLFSERMCRHFREDFGVATRIARYHNIYGPEVLAGRQRKSACGYLSQVAEAKLTDRKT